MRLMHKIHLRTLKGKETKQEQEDPTNDDKEEDYEGLSKLAVIDLKL